MKTLYLTSFITGLALLSCAIFCHAQGTDVISKKTTSILANILNSRDPVQFSKTHGIELENGMIKVVMTVDEKSLPEDFVYRYDLREFRIKKNTASALVRIENLKRMCGEPGVIFVRTPFKFRALSK